MRAEKFLFLSAVNLMRTAAPQLSPKIDGSAYSMAASLSSDHFLYKHVGDYELQLKGAFHNFWKSLVKVSLLFLWANSF